MTFFLLLTFTYIGLPAILIEFYHNKAIGVTKGIGTLAGKFKRYGVKYEYQINKKGYSGVAEIPASNDSLIIENGKYYVKYFPLFPSQGYIDFDDPVGE